MIYVIHLRLDDGPPNHQTEPTPSRDRPQNPLRPQSICQAAGRRVQRLGTETTAGVARSCPSSDSMNTITHYKFI